MAELSLPPVAKSFYMHCKKCEADRYHRVLAHTSSTSAKVECEVCHSKKTYSLPKTGSTVRRAGLTGSSSAGSSPRTSSRASRALSHTGEYQNRLQNLADVTGATYSIKSKFAENQKIQHPKFGVGFIQKVYSDKVDVLFSDEVRTLMHNRP